jgi:peptide/nickel transport system substrate-binding protein
MGQHHSRLLVAAGFWAALAIAAPVQAERPGGILRINTPDSTASVSIHEEATVFAQRSMMGVFNNLVIYDQHARQASLGSIEPDLATGWSWSEDGTTLTLSLRQGVRWHDGKPFAAADVKCTWEMVAGLAGEKLRINPRKSWYRNLIEVTTNGDFARAGTGSGRSGEIVCAVPPAKRPGMVLVANAGEVVVGR